MSKSIQLKNSNNEKMYPHPYYPVGSIYLSINNINPSKWFGGTWKQIAKGRTLVGVDTNDNDFNTVKKTGGSKSVTLTVDQIPAHSHTIDGAIEGSGAGTHDKLVLGDWSESRWYGTMFKCYNTGGGKAHTNLQPYFTCYIWCRTA